MKRGNLSTRIRLNLAIGGGEEENGPTKYNGTWIRTVLGSKLDGSSGYLQRYAVGSDQASRV